MLPVAALKSTKSSPRIVHHALDVKGWLVRPPTAESARPGSCVECGAPSRLPGGGLGLHGHGLRDRQLRGPPSADAEPVWIVIACRRYVCTSCEATMTVAPRGVALQRHYGYVRVPTLFRIAQHHHRPGRARHPGVADGSLRAGRGTGHH